MKKSSILIYLLVVTSGSLFAQVGVQTEAPVHVLHIDAARNNNNAAPVTNAQILDDVVVTKDGNVGVGKANPSEKLEMEGTIKILDGTQGEGKILASDVNGVASWKPVSDFTETNKYSEWTLRGTGYTFTNSSDGNNLTGASTMGSINEIGLSPVSNYGVSIPAGKYLVLLNGDVASRSEYCQLQVILDDEDGDDSNDNILYVSYYSEWLGGAAFVLNLTETSTIKLRWFDWPTTGVSYYAHAPYTGNYWYTLTFLQLRD